jgi:hypothetical protein
VTDHFTKDKFAWLDKLARHLSVTHFTFRVAYVLASTFLNRRTGSAWPSHKKLAGLVNGKEEGVRAAIRQLVNAGYLQRDEEARGRGHTNVYRLIHKNRDGHTGISDSGGNRKTGIAIPKNRDCHTKKPGSPSPQNPFKNPLKNPTGADAEAGSLATALPTGALARPPKGEQAEAKRAVQARNSAVALSVRPPNPHADLQRVEREITAIIGEQYWMLPEDRATDLRDGWSKGKIGPADLALNFKKANQWPS